MVVPSDPHCLLNNTHRRNDDVVFGLKSCFISLSFSGSNYFKTNILSTKYLYLLYFKTDLSGIIFLEFIYPKSNFFQDYISQQPSTPVNLLSNLFYSGFSLKYFEFILDWVDVYFEVPSLCCGRKDFRQKIF